MACTFSASSCLMFGIGSIACDSHGWRGISTRAALKLSQCQCSCNRRNVVTLSECILSMMRLPHSPCKNCWMKFPILTNRTSNSGRKTTVGAEAARGFTNWGLHTCLASPSIWDCLWALSSCVGGIHVDDVCSEGWRIGRSKTSMQKKYEEDLRAHREYMNFSSSVETLLVRRAPTTLWLRSSAGLFPFPPFPWKISYRY